MPRGARHRVERTKARAHYDRDSIHAILDAGLIAHVGFCTDGQPFVIPMLYARDGDTMLLHGSIASRLVNALGAGIRGLPQRDARRRARARALAFPSFGELPLGGRIRARDAHRRCGRESRRARALRRRDRAGPRGRIARTPDRNELAATNVLRFEIEDASAKIRNGGVKDDDADLELPHWAGVVPQRPQYGAPIADEGLADGVALPPSVQRLIAGAARE